MSKIDRSTCILILNDVSNFSFLQAQLTLIYLFLIMLQHEDFQRLELGTHFTEGH